jgi:RNA polymerase sigma factor (sigma-70 family)
MEESGTDMPDIYETLKPFVNRAVKQAHSTFPDHHDREDTEQAVWVWIYENESTLAGIEGREGVAYSWLLKVAQGHLKGEDQASYGYSKEDAYAYSRDLIESILEMVFVYEDWQSFAVKLDSQPRSKAQVNESGNQLAQYADVKSAVEKLPQDQYNAIVWRYKLRYTFEAMGQEMGITKQGAQRRWDGALNALQKLLGERSLSELRSGYSGRTDPSGTAAQQARIERDWNG